MAERAGLLFAEGKIEKDDFEDLLLGKKDLAEMHALKQTGLASATIDTSPTESFKSSSTPRSQP